LNPLTDDTIENAPFYVLESNKQAHLSNALQINFFWTINIKLTRRRDGAKIVQKLFFFGSITSQISYTQPT